MEDCKKNEKEYYCETIFDRCAKLSLDYKTITKEAKLFEKGCSTKALCDFNKQLNACEDIEGSTCKLDCCDSDGCNSSAMPVISGFLMVICALVSVCY